MFVSYAQVDNLTQVGADGWVDTLVDNFKAQLSVQLGRKERGEVWLDRRMEVGDAITPDVKEALDNSALLVVVMSEGYLASPWCTYEREHFISRMQEQGDVKGRIFLVHKMDIEQSRQPEPFPDLKGMPFFHRDWDGADARTLGFPVPIPGSVEDRPYYQRLDDLSRATSKSLRALREQSGAAPARAEIPATLAADTPASVAESTPPEPGAIFLAETTPDLEESRDNLTRQLDQSGLTVLPAGYYARGPDAFAETMRRDLAASLLFVQILGPYASPPTPDLPKGYEGLQLDLAESSMACRFCAGTTRHWHARR